MYKLFLAAVIGLAISLSPFTQAAIYGGGSGTSGDPYQIWTPQQMNDIGANSGDWGKCFKLMANIDMSIYTGTQYNIIGNSTTPFTGTFDGNSHTISNLTITAPTQWYVGLFGYCGSGGQIHNLGVENVDITGGGRVGGLVGMNCFGAIITCYATGAVSGTSYVGGLAGYNSGPITSCYATGAVSGIDDVGGLVGMNYGSITSCYATGSVSGTSSSRIGGGGLAGENMGSVTSCFWDTQISGQFSSHGGIGLETMVMQNPETYLQAFWDFKGEIANGTLDVWTMPSGGGYPVLAWQLANSPVSNDEMSNAIAVTAGSTISGTSIGATGLDITRNGYKDSADTWYYFDCAGTGKYTLTVQPDGFNSTLGVFDTAQYEVVFNDDFFGEKSVVILNAAAGQRYYIRAAGYNGQTGNFTLTITQGAIQAIQGDLNYDGMVNLVDFAIFAENWMMGE